jgi:hypothetical protein
METRNIISLGAAGLLAWIGFLVAKAIFIGLVWTIMFVLFLVSGG